jgi:putative glutamine amidotransferase
VIFGNSKAKPRIGIPYRTKKEQLAGGRGKIRRYLKAVELGGGRPVEVSLDLAPGELRALAETLDGIALSGSPADIDPQLFSAARHAQTNFSDPDRERTDFALLEHCLAQQKPVLAICYGIQSLNVFLGGSLVQDIAAELHSPVMHEPRSGSGEIETFHNVHIERGSRLAELAGPAREARVNSTHHQSVLAPGRDLRVTARAADGVIEALELTPGNGAASRDQWVTAVQWHPERMVETDALALALFRGLVAATRRAPVRA